MIALILSFLAKIGIGTIATKIADAYAARADAETEQAKIAAEERIRGLEARRDVMIAEGRSPVNAIMRAFIAIGPALYLFKIFVIDKLACPALGLACRTDQLSPELWQVVTYVLGFYFLADTATAVTRIIKRKP